MTLLSPLPEADPMASCCGSSFVLLVDDDDIGRESIARLLDHAGHPCIDVGSGREALDLCGDRLPRLVITDLCMPGLDGQGLGRCLRDRFPGLALILITAQPLDEGLLVELQNTFDEVLSKPVDCDRLLDRVSHLAL
ncbi:response regulator [Tautonia rosea]|uniref:response regulator n=1 Tax=Tautonia rosea TaxID=2728037 RepID=UPI001473E7C2|nr:response regulator [Tautonia rosea]